MSGKETKSVRCVRDIRKFPPDNYRLPGDGRKWLAVAKERRALAIQLATYANGDGSNITVGTARMVRELGWSRRTLFRRLDDLEKLGLLSHDGGKRKGQHGTRYRKLNQEVFAGISECQIPILGVSDSTTSECQTIDVGVPDSILGVSDTDSRSATIRDTQPTVLTDKEQTVSTNRPSNQNRDGWLVRQMERILSKKTGIPCTATKDEIQKVNDLAGHEDLPILLGFYYFVERDRGLAGIQYPISMFVGEAGKWIQYAAKETRGHRDFVVHTVADLMDEYHLGFTERECMALCELAYLEAELNDSDKYDLEIVRDYLAGHYGALKAIEPVGCIGLKAAGTGIRAG